jgi:hypothetical protein
MFDPFRLQDGQDAGKKLKNLPLAGFRWSKYNDPDVLIGRIGTDVSEIEVEGEQHTAFGLTRRADRLIIRTTEPFVMNGVARPASAAKQLGGLDRQVLVEFRAHRTGPD